jgi:hypothetical protein
MPAFASRWCTVPGLQSEYPGLQTTPGRNGERCAGCAGRRSNSDLERGTPQVLRRIAWNKAEHRWEERESTKTGRDRVLVLGPRSPELLRAHRAQVEKRARGSGVTLRPDAFAFPDAPDAWCLGPLEAPEQSRARLRGANAVLIGGSGSWVRLSSWHPWTGDEGF